MTELSRAGGPRRFDVVSWLTLYVALLLFVPSKLILAPLGSAGAPSMLFGLVSLLLWGALLVGRWRPVPRRPAPIKLAVFLFLFSVGVTYTVAMARPISPDEVSPADVALLALASWAGTMLLAHDGLTTRTRIDDLIFRLVLCGAAIAVLGLAQIVTNEAWVDRLTIPGLTYTEPPGLQSRGGRIRPSGTAVHPIEYGVLISMLFPLALHVGFHHTARRRVVRWIPAFALGAVVPLTSSRSAYLGAAVGLVICLVGWPRARRMRMAAVGLLGGVVMAAVTPSVLGSILSLFRGASEDPSIESRTGSIGLATEFIARDPFLGRGLGTFLPKYRIFDNQYLGLLVAIGVVGTALFLLVAVVATVVLRRLRRTCPSEDDRDLALVLIASIVVGFASLSMFDAFSFPMTMGTLFLLLGVGGALVGVASVAPTPPPADASQAGRDVHTTARSAPELEPERDAVPHLG